MFPFKKSLLSLFIVGFACQAQAQNPSIVDSTFFKNLSFRNVGPTRGGRATTVQGAVKTPGTFYMGTTGGGVWKTEDYGINWSNISDGFFKSPSIGAIKVYQEDPKIIYIGTGSDGIRSNIIVGDGMYKSENAGKTWTHIGLEKVKTARPNAGLTSISQNGRRSDTARRRRSRSSNRPAH